MTHRSILALCATFIALSHAQSMWFYDPTVWRSTPNCRPNVPSYSLLSDSLTLASCKTACIDAEINCVSFTWDGDTTSSTDTGTCNMYSTRFGFQAGGFSLEDGAIGDGQVARLEFKGGVTYFEKPMDLDDTLEHHLIANALRLNSKSYNQYAVVQEDPDVGNNYFDYDQFLMYYRDGIPGYVNNSLSQSNNKYSVIVEYEDVADAEECAKYCTRERGTIDATLGTRCISFNYNTDGRCHLLTFSLDGTTYNMDEDLIPRSNAKSLKEGWFYYEGLVGGGCWVVQSQCRKWDDDTYRDEQAVAGNSYTVGKHVGIIREYAYDPVCAKCQYTQDFLREYEYICMEYARLYHEDYCDNDVDKATVAYWAQDGAGVANIWNSWDLTQGCVIDLEANPFDGTLYDCQPNNTAGVNPRFAGKKFRDSIGEEEFAAASDKTRCWERAMEWYEYCGIAAQGGKYLRADFPSDGSFFLAPAIDCQCDSMGLKLESGFGTQRAFCTRDSEEELCWRENQQDYWSKLDILCDDLTEGQECETAEHGVSDTGCYLMYPQPSEDQVGKVAIEYQCADGGKWDAGNFEFSDQNGVQYAAIKCDKVSKSEDVCEDPSADFDASTCKAYAEIIHNSCGNDLEEESQQIMVWYRPTGEIFVFPDFALPYETTVIRGITKTAKYTEDPSLVRVDMMPIRNGRWMTFKPTKTGNLRQIDVYYQNTDQNLTTLTMTVWSGVGITSSIFLNQVSIEVGRQEADYVRFPLDNITVTAGETYTWQVTATAADPNLLGDLGYTRGNNYPAGIGDLAWDYLFIAWIEGDDTENNALKAIISLPEPERPWFEIYCIMIMILFFFFLVFLCLLHWKRKWDEDQERRADKKFQAELRQRAMLQAEAERNARSGVVRDEEDEDYDEDERDEKDREVSDYDREEEVNGGGTGGRAVEEEYEEEAPLQTTAGKRTGDNYLSPGGGTGAGYNRVKSASKNEMVDSGLPLAADAGDGYVDPDAEPKKKKKKKKGKKKKKKKHVPQETGDYDDEYADAPEEEEYYDED